MYCCKSIRNKEIEIQDALDIIDDLNRQLDAMGLETEEKHSHLFKEVTKWK